MVPSTIVMPRDGSFALALFGSLRRVHEPILNSLASKRIVDLFPCSLSDSGIAAISASTFFSPCTMFAADFSSCMRSFTASTFLPRARTGALVCKPFPVPLGDDFDGAVGHFYGGLIVNRVCRH